jgi:hypothetical protein
MKKVRINGEGFLESPYINDASIENEVDDETYEMIMTCMIGMNWRLIDGTFTMVDILDEEAIRKRRQIECFNSIDNRSQLWWEHLSEEKQKELNEWYEAWLAAPETKVIPEKPSWIN